MQKIFFSTKFSFFAPRMAGYPFLDSNGYYGDFMNVRISGNGSFFFMQRRFMERATKGAFLLSSSFSSSSKLIIRPVSKFLLTVPEHQHLYELGQNSLYFSGKVSFEIYSLISMLSLDEQHSFHKGLVQKIVTPVPVSQHNTYLKSVLFKIKQEIVEYVSSFEMDYKEEVLTAFTIGDMACNSSTTSFTLMMEIKHYFILYDLNMRYGSENLKFVMALGKIGIKTPDYNLLDFAKNAIVVVDGKAPEGASSSTLLSEVKSIYGLESRCAIDFDSSQFKFSSSVSKEIYFFDSKLCKKNFLLASSPASESLDLMKKVNSSFFLDLNINFKLLGYDIKIKAK